MNQRLEKLKKFLITPDNSIKEALIKIDGNKRGFLVVIDNDRLYGVLTDGDIRRALINGKRIDSKVKDICVRSSKYVKANDELVSTIDLFKNESIKFLPIVDDAGNLVNIITKKQLHTVLLQDIHADLLFDFASLDDNAEDYEIFSRPWGFYKTTIMNNYCQGKIICVYPKAQLSLQSHDHREEHWIIAHGKALVQIGESKMEGVSGSSYFIPKGCKHRLTNMGDKENLVITEVQIGDYFGEDDIHRYEDIYGRVK